MGTNGKCKGRSEEDAAEMAKAKTVIKMFRDICSRVTSEAMFTGNVDVNPEKHGNEIAVYTATLDVTGSPKDVRVSLFGGFLTVMVAYGRAVHVECPNRLHMGTHGCADASIVPRNGGFEWRASWMLPLSRNCTKHCDKTLYPEFVDGAQEANLSVLEKMLTVKSVKPQQDKSPVRGNPSRIGVGRGLDWGW
jgi:hypothetical protein